MAYQDEVLADGPSGYWRMNETSGGTAFDSSGNNWGGLYNGGYVLNQPTMVGGGVSAYLNGQPGTYVGVTDNAALFGTASITVECWVYPSAPLVSGSFVNRRNGSNVGGFTLEANPNGTQFFANVGGTWYAANGPRVTLWAWNHVVGVFTSGRHELWLNGKLFALTTAGVLNNPAGPITLEFGRNIGGGQLFTGRMDEVAIYPTALTAARILAHYTAGKITYPPAYTAIMQDAPVGYWRLDEPSGTVANDSSGYFVSGTYTGPVTLNQPGALLTEPAGTSVSFPKNGGGYVSIPQSGNLDTPSGWSVECWAYVRSYSATGESPTFFASLYPGGDSSGHIPVVLAFNYEAGGEQKVFVGYHHGTLGWTKCVQNGVFPLNTWTHVAGVFTGSSLALYLNGVLNATLGATIANAMPTASPRYIGRRWDSAAQNPDAVLDEVVLYNKALGGDRIAAHYLGGVSKYASEVAFDSPLLFWRFGGDTGGVATDASGFGRTGTYFAGTSPGISCLAGDANASTLYNGTSGYQNRAWDAGMLLGTGPGTLEAWVRLDAGYSGNPRVIAFGGNMAWQMFISGGSRTVCVFLFNGGVLDTGYALTLGQTYHLCATMSAQGAGNIVLYVNGAPVFTTANIGGTNNNSGYSLQVGQSGNNADWWMGLIDEVAIYNTQLSAPNVANHFQAGAGTLQRRTSGSTWVPAAVRRWDGAQWVPALPKRWDGSAWV